MKLAVAAVLLFAACKGKEKAPAPTPEPTAPAPAPPTPEAPVHTVKTDMPPASEITSLVKANNNFALELWQKQGAGNLAISPLSISTALTMAWAGAKGDTADEMRKVMHFEGDADKIVSQWARVSYAMRNSPGPMKLKMANRLYGDAHYQFDTIYFTITRKAFDAPLEIVDFTNDSEAVRLKINTWVAEQTEQKIKDLMPPRSVDSATRLVIVNAIYFLADWAMQFDPSQTKPRAFHVKPGATKQVPTMSRMGTFNLAQADGASLLELPYKADIDTGKGGASMYILLPDQKDGLAALERELPAKLRALQTKLAAATVQVYLPKFTIDMPTPLDLVDELEALGMKQAFDPAKADFSGMAKVAKPDSLVISQVLHKAFVKVDEKGTEASAATALGMPMGGPPPKPITFTADHPFLFMIVDRGSGLILFIGRVADPS